MNDEDRDYGVLVLGVLAAVLLLVVGWSTGMVPGNPAFNSTPAFVAAPETVAATEAAVETEAPAADLVALTKAGLTAAGVAGVAGELGVELGDTPDTIRLTGEVASEEIKTQAGEIAAAIPGVASVDNQLTVTAPAPVETTAAAAPAAPTLTATAEENGTVVLTGAVPDDPTKTSIGDAITAALPAGSSLDNQLAVDPTAVLDGATFAVAGRARPELFEALQTVSTSGLAGLNFTFNNTVEEVAAPQIETDLNALFAAEPIQFDTGSANISAASSATLDKAAELLKANTDGNVAIEGHTDNVGSEAANQRLSESRANAVSAALIERGVGVSRLSAVGYGPTRPIADNATAEGRQKNRRVEVVVTAA